MVSFPFSYEVGDLLGLGLEVQPEQADTLNTATLVAAVWNVPDPMLDSGDVWYDKTGRPIIAPVVLNGCEPMEPTSVFYNGAYRKVPLVAALSLGDETWGNPLDEDRLLLPGVIGEPNLYSDDGYLWPADLLDMEHHAKPVWDIWPVTKDEARVLSSAHSSAMLRSCWNEIREYLDWESGNTEPEDIEHCQHVLDVVEASNGQMKHMDEFPPYELVLPRELSYKWDRLRDLSQQSWVSYGMTLPEDERRHLFQPYRYGAPPRGGSSPWF